MPPKPPFDIRPGGALTRAKADKSVFSRALKRLRAGQT
jgi:hypothetical protein